MSQTIMINSNLILRNLTEKNKICALTPGGIIWSEIFFFYMANVRTSTWGWGKGPKIMCSIMGKTWKRRNPDNMGMPEYFICLFSYSNLYSVRLTTKKWLLGL
jgi:hypothetical protein